MTPNGEIPGNELILAPHFSADRSIAVAAPPEAVWPWLAQMGFGRAGWYSWDLLDTLGRRSADRLHPEWMIAADGDLVPGGPIAFTASDVEPPHSLVLSLLDKRAAAWRIDFSLAYLLEPDGDRTVLHSRARAQIDGPGGALVARYLLEPGDGFMVRKQLRTVKQRAESIASEM